HENSAGEFVSPGIAITALGYRHPIALDGKKGQLFLLKCDEEMVQTSLSLGFPGGTIPLSVPEPIAGTFRIEVYGKN
ncbi:MAG: hypothetical protein WA876_00980, partial [Candidatus Acidiferrales bacterium]